MLARLVAVLAAALAPLASLAQQQGARDQTAPHAGYSWLWIVAAALGVVALLRTLIGPGRRDRPHPPARRPGG